MQAILQVGRQRILGPLRQAGLGLQAQLRAQAPRHQRGQHRLACGIELVAVGQQPDRLRRTTGRLQQNLQIAGAGRQGQAAGLASGPGPGHSGQGQTGQHHGQAQCQGPEVDPARRALAAAAGQAQLGQRRGIGQGLARQRRSRAQQQAQQQMHVVAVQKGTVPAGTVVQHQAARIQRRHHPQRQAGRCGMHQGGQAGDLQVPCDCQPVLGEARLHPGPVQIAARDARRLRRGRRPRLGQQHRLATRQPGQQQPLHCTRLAGPAPAAALCRPAQPQRPPGQQRVDPQMPGQQAKHRQRQQIDLVRVAQPIANAAQQEGRAHHGPGQLGPGPGRGIAQGLLQAVAPALRTARQTQPGTLSKPGQWQVRGHRAG